MTWRSRIRTSLDLAIVEWVLIAAVTVIGVVLRLPEMNPSSIWLDDAWVALSSRLPWSAIDDVGLTSLGFTALVKLVGSAFGPSSLAFQILPFVFGMAAPIAGFLALRRRISPYAAAVIALMISVSPVVVTYSTRVKQYTFDTFATAVLIGLALSVMDEPRNRSRWARFVITAIIASVVSSIMFVIVAGCSIAIGAKVLAHHRTALPETLRWGAAIGAFAGLYWVLVLSENVNPSVRQYWAGRYVATDEGFTGFLDDVVRFTEITFSTAVPFPSATVAWSIFGASALLLLVRKWWVLVLGLSPYLITVLLSVFELAPLGGGRTDSHLMVAIFIVVGFALDELIRLTRSILPRAPIAADLVLTGALTVLVLFSADYAIAYPDEDIRPLVESLEAQRAPSDGVLLYYGAVWSYGLYTEADVALAETDFHLRLSLYNVAFDDEITILGNRRGEVEEYSPFVDAVTTGRDRVWFISSHYRPEDLEAVETFLVSSGFRIDERTTTPGAELTLWTRE